MLNTKIHNFAEGSERFGGSLLVKKNVQAKNGILHTLDTQITYLPNVYELILSEPSVSKLADFVRSFEEMRFDEYRSIPIDIDENGKTVYDTISSYYNRLFYNRPPYGLGYINDEDSVYTMLLPTNEAWDAAYARIAPSFNVYNTNPAIADSIRNTQISLAIISDLVFRGKQLNPASLDSIPSTSPSMIYNPADLFSGISTPIAASNGLVYLTNSLNYDNLDTWDKIIKIESDYTQGRTVGPATSVATRTVDQNDSIPVSEFRYIDVQATNSSLQPSVTFEIPNVLSGIYDIYVEFLPGTMYATKSANDSTKVMFSLTYMNASGRLMTRDITSGSLVTSGTQKVKMKVGNSFDFPVSNFYDRLWMLDYRNGYHRREDVVVNTKLQIRTNVSQVDINNHLYRREFCIDRIILEPVHK
jgi:uncharacterized surface protein with fasciclin (FAS1) repeats